MPPRYSNTHRVGGEVLGAKHLDNALKQLPKATAKGVLRRALLKSAKPAEAAALALVPVGKTGNLQDSIEISTQLKKSQQKGRTKPGAVEVFIGASTTGGKKGFHAHLIEFGWFHANGTTVPPRPFLRPAWESTKNIVLGTFADEVWTALAKAARTLARKAEKGTLTKTAQRVLGR
jgi:HK97 gp10 family phage protein